MKYITRSDLEDIGRGATLLGSGGGGSPECDILWADQLIEQYGPVSVRSVAQIADDDLIVPIAFIGAPLVSTEKLPSGREFQKICVSIERHYGKKITALVAAEIGGSNAFAPIVAAAPLGLPVIDADTIGRAFPQIEMSSCNLHDICAAPAFLSDSFGAVTVLHEAGASTVEKYFRSLVTAMGSTAAAALYIMGGREAKRALIQGSLSRAKTLGRQLRDGVFDFHLIAKGVISDIEQKIHDGFLIGKIVVTTEKSSVVIEYQNEYLMVFEGEDAIAATPDIIALVDDHTHDPLSIEHVRFGQSVLVATVAVDSVWKSIEGMRLVGPKAFGYGD